MNKIMKLDRRNFLKASAAAGGGLMLGFHIPAANAAYQMLLEAGIHPLHARWTIRDAMDRNTLRRARAVKFATFI